jgi:penicillin-binding protein A
MNQSIHQVAYAMTIAFFVVSLGLVYWQVVRGPQLAADRQFNAARWQRDADTIQRGQILDRHGAPLATTERTDDGMRRRYPYPALAHVVGYDDIRYGTAGLEARFDHFLRGEQSPDPVAALVATLVDRETVGSDVISTIDLSVQRAADEALGRGRGAAIAFDPRTGDVLALASHPFIDPNALAEQFPRQRDDPEAPLVNRVTQGLYPPGSTFKLVTMAAALDSDIVAPDEIFEDPNHGILVGGFFINDPNHPGITSFDTLHALAYSSNSAFAMIGLRLGVDRLVDYARRFGFGQEPTFDLSVSPSRLVQEPGYLTDRVALAVTSIGQGQLQVTPFQMARVAGAVATGGELPQLRLVRAVRAPGGAEVEPSPGGVRHRVMSRQAADATKQGMVLAVTTGGVQTVAIPNVSVAAKSGTAEVSGQDQPHAWMVAFAPAENPRVAVVVIKENAGGGATVAGPIARRILEAALAAER